MNEAAYHQIVRSQLVRLAQLTDVVFGAALILIVFWLPRPDESLVAGEIWIGQLFLDHAQNLIAVLIGLVFVILYWLRSNTLLSSLDRTDGVHTALSIASVFFLLLLLYMVQVGGDVAAPSRRAGESVTVALIGLTAAAAWKRACVKDLVRDGITDADRLKAQLEAFSEPLAALVTIPFAYVGEWVWNFAWLTYIPIAVVLRKRGARRKG
jgi:uncharacterized membrane protein